MGIDIKTTLSLSDDEVAQLAAILGCEAEDLPTALGPYSAAALQEFVRMFLGQKVFTRGSDMREYRLYLLIHDALADSVPNEQRVCDLFQCTQTQARSLIRSTLSKYQYELRTAIDGTLKSIVARMVADPNGKVATATIDNEALVEQLNRALATIDGALPQVQKQRGTVSTYELKESSYNRLCTRFGVPPVEFRRG